MRDAFPLNFRANPTSRTDTRVARRLEPTANRSRPRRGRELRAPHGIQRCRELHLLFFVELRTKGNCTAPTLRNRLAHRARLPPSPDRFSPRCQRRRRRARRYTEACANDRGEGTRVTADLTESRPPFPHCFLLADIQQISKTDLLPQPPLLNPTAGRLRSGTRTAAPGCGSEPSTPRRRRRGRTTPPRGTSEVQTPGQTSRWRRGRCRRRLSSRTRPPRAAAVRAMPTDHPRAAAAGGVPAGAGPAVPRTPPRSRRGLRSNQASAA